MNKQNDGRTPRVPMDVGSAAPPPPISGNTPRFTPTLPTTDVLGGADPKEFARGGNGIFGEPKTEGQKTAADKYKEELQRQVMIHLSSARCIYTDLKFCKCSFCCLTFRDSLMAGGLHLKLWAQFLVISGFHCS